MILLHDKNENDYKSNGLGALDKYIIDPLIRWVLNGEYTLEFRYPLHVFLGQEISNDMQVEVIGDGFSDVFRIKTIEKSMGYVSVYAEQKTFDLIDNFIRDINIVDKIGVEAIKQISAGMNYQHPFNLSSTIYKKNSARMVRLGGLQAIADDGIENSFISRWGGEFERHYNDLKVVEKVGQDRNVVIQYAKDLTGYVAKIDVSKVITRIMPIGFDGLLLDELYVDSPLIDPDHPKIALIKYEDVKAAEGEYADDEDAVPREEALNALRELAEKEFSENNIDKPKASYSIDFVLLSKAEEYKEFQILQDVQGGDYVTVVHPKDGFTARARVIEYERNVLTGEFTALQLGTSEVGLTSQIATTHEVKELVADQAEKTDVAIGEALHTFHIIHNQLIENWKAGYNYVLQNDNPYGLPGGFYSFDKPIGENPTEVSGISGGKIIIANSKNSDGTWNWSTMISGSGLGANTVGGEQIIAGSITADEITMKGKTVQEAFQEIEENANNFSSSIEYLLGQDGVISPIEHAQIQNLIEQINREHDSLSAQLEDDTIKNSFSEKFDTLNSFLYEIPTDGVTYSVVDIEAFKKAYAEYEEAKTAAENSIQQQTAERFSSMEAGQATLGKRIGNYEEQLKLESGLIAMYIDRGYGLEQAMTLAQEELAFYLNGTKKVWIGLNGLNANSGTFESLNAANHKFDRIGTEYTVISWTGGE